MTISSDPSSGWSRGRPRRSTNPPALLEQWRAVARIERASVSGTVSAAVARARRLVRRTRSRWRRSSYSQPSNEARIRSVSARKRPARRNLRGSRLAASRSACVPARWPCNSEGKEDSGSPSARTGITCWIPWRARKAVICSRISAEAGVRGVHTTSRKRAEASAESVSPASPPGRKMRRPGLLTSRFRNNFGGR